MQLGNEVNDVEPWQDVGQVDGMCVWGKPMIKETPEIKRAMSSDCPESSSSKDEMINRIRYSARSKRIGRR